MKKIIILSSVLLIVIAFLAVRYFSELSVNNNNNTKVLKYIPSDAALVMSFNNDESFYDIFKNYELFDAVLGETRAAELTQLRALLLQQASIKELTQQKKIFVSFHPQKADSVDILFSLTLNKTIRPDDPNLLSGLKGVSVKKEAGAGNLYKVTLESTNRPLFLCIYDDVILASFSGALLKRVADTRTERISKEFVTEINENSSKNLSSPVSLFINHDTLPAFFASFLRGKQDGNSALLKKLRGVSALNMNFKHNALMFNGISTPDTTEVVYLNLFLNQHPVLNQLKNLLPERTANAILFACSDYKKFQSRLHQYLQQKGELKQLQSQLKMIRNQTGINIENDFKPQISNEFAVVETMNRERFGLIKLLNGTRVNFTLGLISEQISENIGHLNNSNILYYYFGDAFKSFTRPYFSVIDNYLIIANSPGVIQNYLNDYSGNRFISKTKEYAEHDQLIANKSNILYFLNTKNSEQLIGRVLKKGYAKAFTSENYGLKNFYGLSWQWSSDGDHFQVNLYANYPSGGKKELKPAWSFNMNARIATIPWIVRDGNKNMIIAEDNVNNLYGISGEGKRLWAYQIDNEIEGSIHQLSDGTLLFNTSRKLYHIDKSGNNINGFPVSLPFNASAGLTINGENPSSLKIFIPAQNTILAYDIGGKTLPGWNKQVPGRILFDLKQLTVNNTGYLVAGTKEGRFFFFRQNGEMVTKAEVKTRTQFKNPLFVNPEKAEIVTTDTAGTVYYINLDGRVSETSTGHWSPEHKFMLANVAGDSSPELVYLDKSQLSVLSQAGSLIYTYTFEQPVRMELQAVMTRQDEYRPGVSSLQNNQLFLFEEDGNLFRGFPVKGTGYFNIGYLRNDGIRYLVSGTRDNLLQAFKL